MFGKNSKTSGPVATVAPAPNTGMAMMMRTLGIDPAALEGAANDLFGMVKSIDTRLSELHAQNALIIAQNAEILARMGDRKAAPETSAAGDETGEAAS